MDLITYFLNSFLRALRETLALFAVKQQKKASVSQSLSLYLFLFHAERSRSIYKGLIISTKRIPLNPNHQQY